MGDPFEGAGMFMDVYAVERKDVFGCFFDYC